MLKRLLSGMLAAVLAFGLVIGIPQTAEAATVLTSSDKLIDVLKTMEGFSAKPYWDYNQWTVGYGTECPDDKLEEYKTNGITEKQAQDLLEKDLESREKAINDFANTYKLTFTQNQFDALVSFTYNCGTSWLSETDGYFNNAVRQGDVSNAFLYGICLWSSAGGEYILIDRRMCEANMYINGVYKASNSGDKDLYPDNFRWVFLDGNGGEPRYKIYAYDSNNPLPVDTAFSSIPTGKDKNGTTFPYTLVGWFTADGKQITALDDSLSRGQVLYAKWKDAEGNVVDIPKGEKPTMSKVIVTGDEVNVRSGPGTFYEKVGKVTAGMELTITEVYEGNGYIWGKFSDGWVCLNYTNYNKLLTITTQPVNTNAVKDSKVKVPVKATGEGLSYQWYYKSKGSSTFKKSSIKTDTYSITMNESYAGRQVYCVITDKYGNSVKTKTVTLGMAVSISKQPKTTSVAEGEKVKLSVSATGDGLTYQWYYKSKGSSKFSKASGTGTSTYSITMTESRSDRQMYCVITDKYGNSVKTNTVTIGMNVYITKQPKSVQAQDGEKVKTSVSATGDGLTYQWYYKSKSSSKFSKSSIKTATYSITMNESYAGRQVYCVITDKYGNSVTTKTVTLGMAVSISKQPKTTSVAEGEKAKLSVSAKGDGLIYQWYYKSKGSSKFSKSSVKTATYSLTMTESRSDRQMYCVITDKYGNSVKTNTVTVGMKVYIAKQPKSAQAQDGDKVKLSVSAKGDGLTYQWYYKSEGASSYTKSTGTGKSTYSITMTESRAGRKMYCIITDKYGNSVKTKTVTLGMEVSITNQPKSTSVPEGEKAKVSVLATGDGLSYQWYYKSKGSSNFKKSSIKTATYSITMNESYAGRQVYCVITDKYGNCVKTNTVTLQNQ